MPLLSAPEGTNEDPRVRFGIEARFASTPALPRRQVPLGYAPTEQQRGPTIFFETERAGGRGDHELRELPARPARLLISPGESLGAQAQRNVNPEPLRPRVHSLT